jgi:AcrR family transcriptional regulator
LDIPVKKRETPVIRARKSPRQARSTQLVNGILEAAVRVLAREGARRFTTLRVADEAGVSVGSLYQYFPNKEAILFRLQTDEWKQTTALLTQILGDRTREPLERLRIAVRAFFRSECDEAELRVALGDAAPLYREASEARELRKAGSSRSDQFMRETLPNASPAQRKLTADIVMTTMSLVGKAVSERGLSRAEVDTFADATSVMLCAYLEKLAASA